MGTGHTPDRSKPEYWENCTVPWVTAADLSSRSNPFEPLLDTDQKVSQVGLANSAAVVHPAGTVMLCRTASVGLITRIGVPMATTQAFVAWTPGPELDSRYLLYALHAMGQEWERLAYGSTHMTIYMPDLESLRIPVPPVANQRAIADYLDSETARIDALIEKKRRMVELVEERYQSSVDQKMANFPPVPLKSVAKYVEGPGIMASDFYDEGVPLVRISGVRSEVVTLDGCNFLDATKVAKTWRHFALRLGDYLISASATMGVVAEVGPEAVGAVPYTGLIRFRPRGNEVSMPYIKHFLRSLAFMRQIDQLKTGTAIEHYGPTHLGEVKIPLPSFGRQQELASEMDEERKKSLGMTALLQRQIEVLAERRQAVITAAVTGALPVPGVAA
jgi:type I restriction enzyme S subunit